MAMTPYPFGNDRDENPCIRVSSDGLSWTPLPGCPDPIVAAPAGPDEHHADTDLVIHDGELRVYFIVRNKTVEQTRVLCTRSRDGREWTEPQCVYEAGWAVSPAVVAGPTAWYMWFVRTDPRTRDASTTLIRCESRDGLAFEAEQPCELSIPGYHVWHVDVLATDVGLEALVTAYPVGRDPARSRLFHATSRDGLSFALSGGPLIAPTRWSWDNRMIYRSTATKASDGRYRLWYSAASWGEEYGVGYLEGTLRELVDPRRRPARIQLTKIGQDARGLLKYVVLRHAPPASVSLLRAAARMLRGG
jgi:hypothetical protein